jgi:hypothetical protein
VPVLSRLIKCGLTNNAPNAVPLLSLKPLLWSVPATVEIIPVLAETMRIALFAVSAIYTFPNKSILTPTGSDN